MKREIGRTDTVLGWRGWTRANNLDRWRQREFFLLLIFVFLHLFFLPYYFAFLEH